MSYPEHILPRKNYKYISTNNIPHGAMFLRTLDNCSAPACADDIEHNTHNYAPSDKVFEGLSVSLLGIYMQEDCKYKVPKELEHYHKDWKMGDNGSRPQTGEYEYCENRRYVGMTFEKLKLYTLKTNNLDANASFWNIQGDTITQMNFSIEHNPTCCNFWHFLINLVVEINSDKKINMNEFKELIDKYNEGRTKNLLSVKAFIHKITKKNKDFASVFVLASDVQLHPLNPKLYTYSMWENITWKVRRFLNKI